MEQEPWDGESRIRVCRSGVLPGSFGTPRSAANCGRKKRRFLMKMKTSNIVSVLVVLGLLATQSSALLTYNNIDWPSEGPLDRGRLRVDDNGNVGIPMGGSARIWDVGTSYTDYGRPATDPDVLLVLGKTASGDVAIATGEDASQGAWFWDASASSWIEAASGRPNFWDQNDTHGVYYDWNNKDLFIVDFATNTSTYVMQSKRPRISVNGTYISGDVPGMMTPDLGTTVIDLQNLGVGVMAVDVNSSGNAVGLDATDGNLVAQFYDYAANTLTAIPTFGDLVPGEGSGNGNAYTVGGMNDSDEVVGWVHRAGETYRGWYWKKGDATLTDLEDLLDSLPGNISAGEMIYGAYGQVTDINNDGWIVGRAKVSGGSGLESFLLTPEPATLLVLAGGALAGLLGRRHR